MCGVTGIVRFDDKSIEQRDIERFNDSLAHRGPDAAGVFHIDHSIALGHRRLSIVDLDKESNQPFVSNCARYIITFNGEIYNYLELKEELLGLGYQFRTASDTEVVLAAYDCWKEECLNRFNGMWAFAIWDRNTNGLFASRDRFGVKPFYYCKNEWFFAFASEQKAFGKLNGFDLRIEPSIAAFAVSNTSIYEAYETTIYQDLKKLRPGEYIKVNRRGDFYKEVWWKYQEHLLPYSDADIALSVFEDACEIRTRTDVDIAFSLSGGMDSSSVVSYTAPLIKDVKKKVKAFIGSFPNSDFDEFDRAKLVAKNSDINYERIVIPKNVSPTEMLDCMVQAEDVMRAPPIGQWFIYKAMKQEGFKVSIEGHGGDELLGGYFNHAQAHLGDCIHQGNNLDEVAHTICLIDSMRSVVGYGRLNLPLIIRRSTGLSYSFKRKGFLSQYMSADKASLPTLNYLESNQGKPSLLQASLINDFTIFTLPNILRNYDKASMGQSVEVRSPFLDWRFVLNAIALPPSQKIRQGKTKAFLRDHLIEVPELVRQSDTKLGFNFPLINWLKNTYESFLREFLNDSIFLDNSLFDGKKVASAINKKIDDNRWNELQAFWPLIHLAVLDGYVSGGRE